MRQVNRALIISVLTTLATTGGALAGNYIPDIGRLPYYGVADRGDNLL
jgi:hypothetical protein